MNEVVLATERPAARPGTIDSLRALGLRLLPGMFLGDRGLFTFRMDRSGSRLVTAGASRRYTAITIIGLSGEPAGVQREVLGGRSGHDVIADLARLDAAADGVGDGALMCWAAAAAGADAGPALARLVDLQPDTRPCPTVELSWALSALSVVNTGATRRMRDAVALRLMHLFDARANGFPHDASGGRELRTHVSCFADQVYPILALSQYASVGGHDESVRVAARAADHLCELQGRDGQWWWHYHARIGSVVERYPVYSVHQHAMGPMALLALQRASGRDYSAPIARGLQWLWSAPELNGGSLVDERAGVVWRKVARREPRKAARYLQAMATWIHPSISVPGLDRVFPPGAVDHECRPYEIGWLLYAWPHASHDGGRQ